MCGIVGYVGQRPVQELLLQGLRALEYRGYDSAGVSILGQDGVDSVRAVGNLDKLVARVQERADGGGVATATRPATTGIAHTRWATHGRVTEGNAHPLVDGAERVHVVANGIVENYVALRQRLAEGGAAFRTETDTEVIAHLIAHHLAVGRGTDGDAVGLVEAVRGAYGELEGHFAFVAMDRDDPDTLVGVRKECPLVVGVGDDERFFASAVPAFLGETRRVQYVENDEIVVLRPGETTVMGPEGDVRARPVDELDWDQETAEKAGYETFMLKEIHEQAEAVAETVVDRTARETGVDLGAEIDEAILRDAKRILIVACGTSYHAGLIGRYAIQGWSRVPVGVDIASEFRYADPIVGPGDLVVGITQSGETADTLAAMRVARERGATVLAVTNVMGSQATRDADAVLYTRAGLEVGVAATKTFLCQVAVMYLLALRLAELHETLEPARVASLTRELRELPTAIAELVARAERDDSPVAEAAERHWGAQFYLYLGRHVGLPVALEGALKLKEISYIPTDAYAAGEMKHGPIALLSEATPVVCVATASPVLDKVVSNMQEVRARGAHVIAVATEGDAAIGEHAEEVLRVPETDWMLQPLLAVIPLQLLAYRIARHRGLNVDQPRNLAKTVTVE